MRRGARWTPILLLVGAAAGCQGDGTPTEVLPRILEGECVRIAMQTRAGERENLLVIESLRARTTGEAGCGQIGRIEVGGYMDLNGDDEPGDGERLRTSVHRPPGGPADEVTLTGVEVQLPDDDLAALRLEIDVHFTSGKTTLIEVGERD